jgi:hypothetical protein
MKTQEMIDQLDNKLESIIRRHIAFVGNELNRQIQAAGKNSKAFTYSWYNPQLIVANVSLFQNGDPAEDSIDFCIDLTKQPDTSILFECYIAYSNGEIIEEITRHVIAFKSEDDLLDQIDKLSQESVSASLTYWSTRTSLRDLKADG